MAFLLKVSNSLEVLAARLCREMQEDDFPVLQPIYIVTQTEGINNWLNLKIAEQLGIAANIIFLKPNDLIYTAYKAVGGSKLKALNGETLSWLIFHELGQAEFLKDFPAIANYYHAGTAADEVKKMALAQKLADLFDQYQVYRADMMQEWNKPEKNKVEWQEFIWRKIQSHIKDELPDKTEMAELIRHALKEGNNAARLKQKMPVVYFFGLSIITSFHLQILHELAKGIDIKFLLLNPAPGDYWFEDMDEKRLIFLKRIGKVEEGTVSQGNQLLLSWGKLLQNTFYLLFQEEDIINSYEELDTVLPEGDSLLHKVQLQITENTRDTNAAFSAQDLGDESIVINSCFSPMREVQAFYNYLVHLIKNKKEALVPRDVIVMVSDIDLYAPYIKAVFDTAPTKFKYQVADASVAAGDGVISALQLLLQLRETHLTAENVIRFLDHPCLRNYFSITDPGQLRDLVNAANIRFGIKNNIEDESSFVSWMHGLKRIMYGITMSGEEIYGMEPEDFYPIDLVEGSRSHESIRFVHFVQLLIDALETRKRNRTLKEWVSYVEELLQKFICTAESEDEEFIFLTKRLSAFNLAAENFGEEISYEVFLQNFDTGIMEESRTQDFIRGGITFCSLIPMRSVPFRVVAMLGMNYDKFPRKEKPLSFNLMTEEKRKGDRNIRENDKHLFLETILSAQDYFYVSFVGQSIVSNNKIPASALVDELINYLRQGTEDGVKTECPVYQQPLHAYSNIYKQNIPGIYSYLGEAENAIPQIHDGVEPVYEMPKELSFAHLVRFLKDPIKGYYNDVLNIYYKDLPEGLPETEIFEMDGLQNWGMKNSLLRQDEADFMSWENEQKKKGNLPLKNSGKLVIQKLVEDIEAVKKVYESYGKGKAEQKISIVLEINEVHLKGTIDSVFDDKILIVSFSKNELKYLMQAYFTWLVVNAQGLKYKIVFISGANEAAYEARQITRAEALARLSKLLDVYKKGHEETWCFASQFKLSLSDLEGDAESVFKKAINGVFNNYTYPCADAYLNREHALGFFDSGLKSFKKYAEIVLQPMQNFLPEYFG